MPSITLQISLQDQWLDAATFSVEQPDHGIAGASTLDYITEYAGKFIGADLTRAISCRLPVGFAHYTSQRWQPILLDLLPSGAGRRQWLKQLGLTDRADGLWADWDLLTKATANPIGNLRIKEAASERDALLVPDAEGNVRYNRNHPGFSLQDIVEKNMHFIEYAHQHGAQTAGASDVQGEAPKFLLVQDRNDSWHAEGALADEQVAKSWLVKFPRGSREEDRTVLRNEAAYLEVARALGLTVGEALRYEKDALFIPRFDRQVTDHGLVRLGVESLYALAGVAEYGKALDHETFCEVLALYASDPKTVLTEYVLRDVVNVAMGNKDNHGRNTAVIKQHNGEIALSPLFDFAPMWMDPEGIARVTRWADNSIENAAQPIWGDVAEVLGAWLDAKELRTNLATFASQIERLPETMREHGVEDSLIEHLGKTIENTAQNLKDVQPKSPPPPKKRPKAQKNP